MYHQETNDNSIFHKYVIASFEIKAGNYDGILVQIFITIPCAKDEYEIS